MKLKCIAIIVCAISFLWQGTLAQQVVNKVLNGVYNCPASGNITYVARDEISIIAPLDGSSTLIEGNCANGASYTIKVDPTLTPAISSTSSTIYDSYLATAPTGLSSTELSAGIPGVCIPGNEGVSATGGSTYSIPVILPEGANNMKPDLALSYNSQSGNGIIGWGWALSGLSSISRVGQTQYFDNNNNTAVDLSVNDKFELDGSRLLIKSSTYGANGATYETEAISFSTITSYGTAGTGPQYFSVITKDGTQLDYGTTTDSRLLAANGGSSVVSWMLHKVTDLNGNTTQYNYLQENGEIRIDNIVYGGNNFAGIANYITVQFMYDVRSDISVHYYGSQNGTPIYSKKDKLLKEIEVFVNGNNLRKYGLEYIFDNTYTKLCKVTLQESNGSVVNPTIITWTSDEVIDVTNPGLIHDINSRITLDNFYPGFIFQNSGDFNGDGFTDLFRFYPPNPAHNTDHGYFDIYISDQSGTRFIKLYGFDGYKIGLSQQITSVAILDRNGDGKDEIALMDNSLNVIHFISLNYTDNPDNATVTNNQVSVPIPGRELNMMPGDFDGNGITDILLITSTVDICCRDFYGFIMNGGTSIDTKGGFQFKLDNPAQVIIMDFNGNGKADILCVNQLTYSIYEQSGVGMSTLVDNVVGLNYWDNIHAGDYNGDGKTDLFLASVHHSSNAVDIRTYNTIMASTGTNFIEGVLPDINNSSYIAFQTYDGNKYLDPDKTSIETGDFNADGKSDIVFISDMGSTYNFTFYYGANYSVSFGRNVSQSIVSRDKVLSGDFDGNGATDLVAGLPIQFDYASVIVRGKNSGTHKTVESVINGFGNKIKFTYQTVTFNLYGVNTNDFAFYKPAGSSPAYPLANYRGAVWAVASITKPDGTGAAAPFNNVNNNLNNNTTIYSYRGGSIHLNGKGFLGFNKVIANDPDSYTWRVDYYNYNTTYYVPYRSKTESYFDNAINFEQVQSNYNSNPSNLLSKVEYTPNFVSASATNPLIYFQSPDLVVSTDYTTYKTVTKNSVFDKTTGEISYESTNYGNKDKDDAAGELITTYTYNTYTTYNNLTINKLISTSTFKSLTESNQSSRRVTYTQFDTYARPTTVVFDNNKTADLSHTNQYTYDNFGNVLTLSETGGGKTVNMTNTYSADGRFLLSHNLNNEPATIYAYDNMTGFLVAKTDPNGLSSSFDQYDAIGRLLQSTNETNIVSNITYAWNTDATKPNVLSQVTTKTTGMPTSTEYYDMLGRNILTQATAYSNNVAKTIESSVVYDEQGREDHRYMPHYIDETGIDDQYLITNTYIGDGTNRLQSVKANKYNSTSRLTTTYQYNLISSGSSNRWYYQTQTTLPTPAGQASSTKSSVVNECDLPVSSIGEDGNTVAFTKFDGSGEVTETDVNGTSVTSLFDGLARQSSFTDPSYGTITSDYYVYGQPYHKTTPKCSTIYTYDNFWRISNMHLIGKGSNALEDMSITSTYYPQGSASYGQPQQVSFDNGSAQKVQYIYDSKGRLQQYAQDITPTGLNKTFTLKTTLSYDETTGNLSRKVFPSGLSLDYIYDAVGNLIQVNRTGGAMVWTLVNLKANGQPLQIKYGNNAVADYTYDALTSYRTEQKLTLPGSNGIYYYRTAFEPANGNLLYRTNFEQNSNGNLLYEYYKYDAAERLTGISQVYTAPLSASTNPTYTKPINYNSNGNITNKYDAGMYSYNSTGNPYNVESIDPTGYTSSTIPQQEQDIVYNMFDRVASITENGNTATFTYGPNLERIAMKDGNSYIIYGENYEAQLDASGNIVKEWTYITGPDGIAAVWINNGVTTTMYYAHTDHLGSVLLLTKEDGSVQEKNSFDAWGRRRDPSSLSYFTSTPPAGLLRRGFTFHEHLDNYGLINMNARLYDPALGRFLSPDTYIQLPDNAQSYNRYTYCLNNPLKYTDPTGKKFLVDDAVFMIVGGTINLITAAVHGKVHSVLQGIEYFGVGALAGEVTLESGPEAGFAIAGLLNVAVDGSNGYLKTDGAISPYSIDFSKVYGSFLEGGGNATAAADFGPGLVSIIDEEGAKESLEYMEHWGSGEFRKLNPATAITPQVKRIKPANFVSKSIKRATETIKKGADAFEKKGGKYLVGAFTNSQEDIINGFKTGHWDFREVAVHGMLGAMGVKLGSEIEEDVSKIAGNAFRGVSIADNYSKVFGKVVGRLTSDFTVGIVKNFYSGDLSGKGIGEVYLDGYKSYSTSKLFK